MAESSFTTEIGNGCAVWGFETFRDKWSLKTADNLDSCADFLTAGTAMEVLCRLSRSMLCNRAP
jgi:hypothetical protein